MRQWQRMRLPSFGPSPHGVDMCWPCTFAQISASCSRRDLLF